MAKLARSAEVYACQLAEGTAAASRLFLFTFGAPGVGNPAFVEHFHDRLRSYALVRGVDPRSHVPPWTLATKHGLASYRRLHEYSGRGSAYAAYREGAALLAARDAGGVASRARAVGAARRRRGC